MKRGVIQVTKEEIQEFTKLVDIKKYSSTPLEEKLKSVLTNSEGHSLELSEEEIELMLDEIVIPVDGEPKEITSLRGKFGEKLMEFRNEI